MSCGSRLYLSLLFLLSGYLSSHEARGANLAPDEIIKAGLASVAKLERSGASWTSTALLPNGKEVSVDCLMFGTNRHWYLRLGPGGTSKAFCKIVEKEGQWFVTEGDYRWTCRPYESTFATPAVYYFLSISDAKFVTDASMLKGAVVDSADEGIVTFRVPLSAEHRKNV